VISLWHFFPNRYHWEVIMAGKRNKPLTVTEAAEKGDQLAEMKAMRLVVARRIEDETNGAALAALVRGQVGLGHESKELGAELGAGSVKAVAKNVVNAEAKFRPEAI